MPPKNKNKGGGQKKAAGGGAGAGGGGGGSSMLASAQQPAAALQQRLASNPVIASFQAAQAAALQEQAAKAKQDQRKEDEGAPIEITPQLQKEVDTVYGRIFSDELMTLSWDEGIALLHKAEDLLLAADKCWTVGKEAAVKRENGMIQRAAELAGEEFKDMEALRTLDVEVTSMRDLLMRPNIRYRDMCDKERRLVKEITTIIQTNWDKVCSDEFEALPTGPERQQVEAGIQRAIEGCASFLPKLHLPPKAKALLQERCEDLLHVLNYAEEADAYAAAEAAEAAAASSSSGAEKKKVGAAEAAATA